MRKYYHFKQVRGGYRWNMLKRITLEVGVAPAAIGDADDKTFILFEKPLTKKQHENLDRLMKDNPTRPPKTKGTRFIVKDVQNFQDEIEAEMGLSFLLYYSESKPDSGVVDQLELIFDRPLTPEEEQKVKLAYANLITKQ